VICSVSWPQFLEKSAVISSLAQHQTRVLVIFGCPRIQSLYIYIYLTIWRLAPLFQTSGDVMSWQLGGTCHDSKFIMKFGNVSLEWTQQNFSWKASSSSAIQKIYRFLRTLDGLFYVRIWPRIKAYWSNLEKHNFWRTILLFKPGRHFMVYCQINTLFCTVSLIFTTRSHLRYTNLV